MRSKTVSSVAPRAIRALGPRIIDAGHQGKTRAVVPKQAGRPADGGTLAQRLGDLEMGRHRPVDVDQLAMLAQRVEKVAKILKRHDSSRDARRAGLMAAK